MSFHPHAGIDCGERFTGAVDLEGADAIGHVHDLSLQVSEIDPIGIGDPDRAHPSRSEIEQQRRAEAAGADNEYPRREQADLPLLADLVEDQVPRISLKLLLV